LTTYGDSGSIKRRCPNTPSRLSTQYRKLIELLWNSGVPRTLSLGDIDRLVGKGAYGNHSKLSYSAWDLVEDDGDNQHRRLTERGKQFAQGSLTIPKEVDDKGNAVGGIQIKITDV
jgi:hypothetical protein